MDSFEEWSDIWKILLLRKFVIHIRQTGCSDNLLCIATFVRNIKTCLWGLRRRSFCLGNKIIIDFSSWDFLTKIKTHFRGIKLIKSRFVDLWKRVFPSYFKKYINFRENLRKEMKRRLIEVSFLIGGNQDE